jgi:hypothetical protein
VPDPEQRTIAGEEVAALNVALTRVDPDERELLVRHEVGGTNLATLAGEAAGDHQNCAVKFRLAERPIPLADAGRRYGAPYAALATFEPPTVDGRLEMLERHACVYQGRRFGHVVFRYRGALTSLLVTDGPPPPAPQVETDDAGRVVASLPAGRFVAFVVADLDAGQVLGLAQSLASPLARHLA